jgi:hypothetical protein
MQFSKEPIMSNFGELPFGEIPEPLKYVRPFRKFLTNILSEHQTPLTFPLSYLFI